MSMKAINPNKNESRLSRENKVAVVTSDGILSLLDISLKKNRFMSIRMAIIIIVKINFPL